MTELDIMRIFAEIEKLTLRCEELCDSIEINIQAETSKKAA